MHFGTRAPSQRVPRVTPRATGDTGRVTVRTRARTTAPPVVRHALGLGPPRGPASPVHASRGPVRRTPGRESRAVTRQRKAPPPRGRPARPVGVRVTAGRRPPAVRRRPGRARYGHRGAPAVCARMPRHAQACTPRGGTASGPAPCACRRRQSETRVPYTRTPGPSEMDAAVGARGCGFTSRHTTSLPLPHGKRPLRPELDPLSPAVRQSSTHSPWPGFEESTSFPPAVRHSITLERATPTPTTRDGTP